MKAKHKINYISASKGNAIETWHHTFNLGKTPNDATCGVAMAITLLPGPLFLKRKSCFYLYQTASTLWRLIRRPSAISTLCMFQTGLGIST